MTTRAELTHPEDAGPAGPRPPRLGSLVQYALLAGPLLSMLDSSIVNVAVEPIARELHASLTTVQWTVSGYRRRGADRGGRLARHLLHQRAARRAGRPRGPVRPGRAGAGPQAGSLPFGLHRPGHQPLLQALTEPLRPDQLGDANTLFNTWQRIAGSFGIGLLAALYATQSRTHGPVRALHLTGLVLAAIAATAALAALALPASPNIALSPD